MNSDLIFGRVALDSKRKFFTVAARCQYSLGGATSPSQLRGGMCSLAAIWLLVILIWWLFWQVLLLLCVAYVYGLISILARFDVKHELEHSL